MKRLVIPILAALALPTALSAKVMGLNRVPGEIKFFEKIEMSSFG